MLGQTLSHYEILEKLGEGGMGVVYKARDTKLNRLVALKVLPPEKLTNPERKRRFLQEAQSASALNHANIVTIHEISSDKNADFLVMEFVSGKTLDLLIAQKSLRPSDTLKYAIQIADALTAAHTAGIIHRDLKPSNIIVSDHGVAKVLDFGLAKLVDVTSSPEDETRTIRQAPANQTAEGSIIGTAAYMSPEQAEGKTVDSRSDIFSFGALLYEMVTGVRAFQGESGMSTLGAVIHKDPRAVQELNPSAPLDLAKLIQRCLRKDPERRFQHMADIKVALADLKEESESGANRQAPPAPNNRRWLGIGLTTLLLASIGAGGWYWLGHSKIEKPMRTVPLTTYDGGEIGPTFSPDGNQIAFSWEGDEKSAPDIYVKLINSSGPPLRLTTDPNPDMHARWSPDGTRIAFVRPRRESLHAEILVVPALGGPEERIAELEIPSTTPITPEFDWFPDSRHLLTTYIEQADAPAGLFRLSLATSKRERITETPPGNLADRSPAVSSDGRQVAFIRGPGLNNSRLYLLDLSASGQPEGPPRPIAPDLPAARPAFSADGREIVFLGNVDGVTRLYRISTSGRESPVPLNTIGGRPGGIAISRQGNRLAYTAGDVDTDIWKLELTAPGQKKPTASFIASSRMDRSPAYSPDGSRVAFSSWRSGYQEIFVADANGRNAKQLTFLEAAAGVPRWSPDGRILVFDSNKEGTYHVYSIGSNGGTPILLTPGKANDGQPSFSRDGNSIYFASNRTGNNEIWKMPTNGGAPVQITHKGGLVPIESFDGKMLYYCGIQGLSLRQAPSGGGEETTLIDEIASRSFSVARDGIYYFMRGKSPGFFYLDSRSRKSRRIADGDESFQYGLSVSPDERSLLFVTRKPGGADLMLIENFR